MLMKNKILEYLKNYNVSLIDHRQRKMAKMIRGYNYILDLGFAANPNPYLNNNHVVGVDIMEIEKPENYSEVIFDDVITLRSFIKENSVDAILCGELLEHLENPFELLKSCNKVLSEEGILVLSTPNPHYIGEILLTMCMIKKLFYTRNHFCLYPQRWLIRMLERAGFKNVRIYAGGIKIPYLGTIPFFRTFGLYTIALAKK